jgi:HSP20 family protein
MRTLIKKTALPTFFDEFFADNMLRNRVFPISNESNFQVPALNIKETEKDYQIELAAPGMEKSDFKISIENKHLTIATEKKEEKSENTENYTRREFGYFSFKRSFELPQDKVEAESIEAKYEAGVLRLSIPKKVKSEETPKLRTIEIV